MNIINYKCGFRNIRKCEYFMRENKIVLCSRSKDKGFVNYIDVIGNKHDDLFTKTISINDKGINEMYSLELFVEINTHKEPVRIRNNKVFFCIEIRGLEKDIDHDYMVQAGFIAKDVQWDKYGLHWNYYSLDYSILMNKFKNVRLYTVKKDSRKETEEIKDISFNKAASIFEEFKGE